MRPALAIQEGALSKSRGRSPEWLSDEKPIRDLETSDA